MFLFFSKLPEKYAADVWDILLAVDREFVPPLSSRQGTTQRELKCAGGDGAPREYFEQLCGQSVVLAVEKGKVAGFLSYIPRHAVSTDKGETACAYISTVAVRPEFRRRGLTRGMYEELFKAESGKNIATRTWSANAAHIGLLKRLGFSEVRRIENDRGAGVDTVYYLKANDIM